MQSVLKLKCTLIGRSRRDRKVKTPSPNQATTNDREMATTMRHVDMVGEGSNLRPVILMVLVKCVRWID